MITAEQISASLRLVFYDGENLETGKPVYKGKSFNNIKESATAKQLYDVAIALAELQDRDLHSIERRDNNELTKD